MGADRATHVAVDQPLLPLNVAKLLAAVARKEQPGLFMLAGQPAAAAAAVAAAES